jgi:cytochrome b
LTSPVARRSAAKLLTRDEAKRIAANITTLHDGAVWQALLVAVTLHILAIGLYWAVKGQNLLLPMIGARCSR